MTFGLCMNEEFEMNFYSTLPLSTFNF